jgi:phage gp45-like
MKHSSSRDSANRHGNGLSRTTVENPDDTQFIQQHGLRGFFDEQMDTFEHVHEYGFTSVVQKPTGMGALRQAAESFLSYLGGNRSHGIAVTTADRRFRLYKLANGEVALHDDQGHQVHIARDGVYVSAPNSKKIVGQIMSDDTLPQDSQPSGQGGQKLGQIAQKGRTTTATYSFDKNGFTLNHPNGAVVINAKTFTVNSSGDAKIISGGNALLKGNSAILYAVASAYIKALIAINVKSPSNLSDPPWVPGAADPPISG